MKRLAFRRLSFAALMLTVLAAASAAQDASRPASTNVPNAEYPRVHPDLRVTFRVSAPEAKKVQILPAPRVSNGLGDGPYDMVKDDKGFWTVTIPPAQPGLHNYYVVVDGFASNDPGSEAFPGYGMHISAVEVPDPKGDFYAVRGVPHGEVRIRWYFSKTTDAWRRALVYLPPGYEKGAARYPVLYLQHGSGEDETSWTRQGRVNFILDNLIAAGKAKPMIVVMENGMVAARPGAPKPPEKVQGILLQATPPPPAPSPSPSAPAASPAPAKPAALRGNEAFGDMVVDDLIPMIDSTFRTRTDGKNRAIAGLSMGAGQACQIGLTHLDMFAYIGSFSGVLRDFDAQTSFGGAFKDAAAFNAKVKLLWFGAGKREERFSTASKMATETLTKAGVKAIFLETPFGHEWQGWRYDLLDFAPRLFK